MRNIIKIKGYFIIFCISLSTCAYGFANVMQYHPIICSHPTVLVLDVANTQMAATDQVTTHFRSTNDAIKDPSINLKGLPGLHILGGGQFSAMQFLAIKKKFPNLAYDIDLRLEPHAFVNGLPVSLYGNPNDQSDTCGGIVAARKAQANLLYFLKQAQGKNISILQHASHNVKGLATGEALTLLVKDSASEKEIVEKQHVIYHHVYVADHDTPSDEEVNHFLLVAAKIPKGAWVYFHCHAGEGRTSTFMMMYDMMQNAKTVSFDDIMKRQIALGSSDLFSVWEAKPGKQLGILNHRQFLEKFYQYCKNNHDDFKTPWHS